MIKSTTPDQLETKMEELMESPTFMLTLLRDMISTGTENSSNDNKTQISTSNHRQQRSLWPRKGKGSFNAGGK